MKLSEALAQQLIEEVTGGRMVFRPDQHESIHDFDLHRDGLPVAAVEVTSAADGQIRSTYAAISKRRFIPRHLCKKDWRVHPAPDANIAAIAKRADELLAEVEAVGIDSFLGPRNSDVPCVQTLSRELRVMGASVIAWQRPGIGIALPVTGGAYGPSLVLDAVADLASRSDNRQKRGPSQRITRDAAWLSGVRMSAPRGCVYRHRAECKNSRGQLVAEWAARRGQSTSASWVPITHKKM